MKLVISAILLVCTSWAAGKPTYSAPTPVFPPPFITVVKESRKEPTASGEHSSFFEASNGIVVRQDGSSSGHDGTVVRGEFSYIQEDGSTASVTYIADKRGYQPQSDLLPVGPPIPAHSLLQIERARAAQIDASGSDVESSYLPPKPKESGSDETETYSAPELPYEDTAATPKTVTQKPVSLHTTATEQTYSSPSTTTTIRPYTRRTTTQRRRYFYSSTSTAEPSTTTPQPDLSSEEEVSYVAPAPVEESVEVVRVYLPPSEPEELKITTTTSTETPQPEEDSADMFSYSPPSITQETTSTAAEALESEEQSVEVSSIHLPPSTTRAATTTTTTTTTTEAPESEEQSAEVSAFYLPPSTRAPTTTTTTTTTTEAPESEEQSAEVSSIYLPPSTRAPTTTTTTTTTTEAPESEEQSAEVSSIYLPPSTRASTTTTTTTTTTEAPESDEQSAEVSSISLPPSTRAPTTTTTTTEAAESQESEDVLVSYLPPPTTQTPEIIPAEQTAEEDLESEEKSVEVELVYLPPSTTVEPESEEKSAEVVLTYLPPATTQESTTTSTTSVADEIESSDEESEGLSLFYLPPSSVNDSSENITTTAVLESDEDFEVSDSYLPPSTVEESEEEVETTTEIDESEEEIAEENFYSPPSVIQEIIQTETPDLSEEIVEISSSYIPPSNTEELSPILTPASETVILEPEDESDEDETYSLSEQLFSSTTTEATASTTRRAYRLLGGTYFSPRINFRPRSYSTPRYTTPSRFYTRRPSLFYKAPTKIQIPQLPVIRYKAPASETSEEVKSEEEETDDAIADAVIVEVDSDVAVSKPETSSEKSDNLLALDAPVDSSSVGVGLQEVEEQRDSEASDFNLPVGKSIGAAIGESSDSSITAEIAELPPSNEEAHSDADQNSVASIDAGEFPISDALSQSDVGTASVDSGTQAEIVDDKSNIEEFSVIETLPQSEAGPALVDSGTQAEIVEERSNTEVSPGTEDTQVNSLDFSTAAVVVKPSQTFISDSSPGISLLEANAALDLANIELATSPAVELEVAPVDSSNLDFPIEEKSQILDGSESPAIDNTDQSIATAIPKTFIVFSAEGLNSQETIDTISAEIKPNDSIAAAEGLNSLETIDTISAEIKLNDSIAAAEGLNSLETINTISAEIIPNDSIAAAEGLNSQEAIDTISAEIIPNDSIAAAEGLNSQEAIDTISAEIIPNDSIAAAEGLNSLETIDTISAEIIPNDSNAAVEKQLQADEAPETIKSDDQEQSFGTLEKVFQAVGGTVETAPIGEATVAAPIEPANAPQPKIFTVITSSEVDTDDSISGSTATGSLTPVDLSISEIQQVANRLDILDDILSAELDNSVESFPSGAPAPNSSLSLAEALLNSGDAVVSFIRLDSRESVENLTQTPSIEFFSGEDVTSVEERTDSFGQSVELTESLDAEEPFSVESKSLENNPSDASVVIPELRLTSLKSSTENSRDTSLDDLLDSVEITTDSAIDL